MPRILISMVIIVWILTGCSEATLSPTLTPIKPKIHTIKKCGKLKYERRGQRVILDYRTAKCLKTALQQCGQDRRVLIAANKGMTDQIKHLAPKDKQ